MSQGADFGGENSSQANPENTMATVLEVVKSLVETHRQQMEVQQEQNQLLREELLATRQAAVSTENATAFPDLKSGTVTDFRRLLPSVFSGNESPLEAEQWLVDTTNLLAAARIPEANLIEVTKIQLIDVARTWWIAEEERLTKPIAWKEFADRFYERFFPKTAQQDMEEQFVKLKQKDMTVDAYAAEFLRLSRFAPAMVAKEADRANRFRQGLWLDIQEHLAPEDLETYTQILTAARKIERVVRKKKEKKNEQQATPARQQNKQNFRGQLRGTNTPPAKRQSQPICSFCHKPGHIRRVCRSMKGLCLICGAPDHKAARCPSHNSKDSGQPAVPAPSTLSKARIAGQERDQAYHVEAE